MGESGISRFVEWVGWDLFPIFPIFTRPGFGKTRAILKTVNRPYDPLLFQIVCGVLFCRCPRVGTFRFLFFPRPCPGRVAAS